MKRRTLIQAAPLLMAMPGLASAQAAFPNRPIKYIVPVAAGGGSDMIGRQVCERLSKVLGQSIVVENHGGGGGVIASQMTAKAAPDGYTLMQGYVATHGTAPATRKLNYDPIKDFTPLGMIGTTPNVLVVNANTPVKDVKEFIQKNLLRLGWRGLLDAFDRRVVQNADRCFHGAHPVSRHCPSHHRPDRWPDTSHVPWIGRCPTSYSRRTRACIGSDGQPTPPCSQRCAHHGRGWPQRL